MKHPSEKARPKNIATIHKAVLIVAKDDTAELLAYLNDEPVTPRPRHRARLLRFALPASDAPPMPDAPRDEIPPAIDQAAG